MSIDPVSNTSTTTTTTSIIKTQSILTQEKTRRVAHSRRVTFQALGPKELKEFRKLFKEMNDDFEKMIQEELTPLIEITNNLRSEVESLKAEVRARTKHAESLRSKTSAKVSDDLPK